MSVLIDILAAGAVNSSGAALDTGVAYIYQVGTTSKATIYSDSDLTLPISNPVTLDGAGRAEVYTSVSVRLILEDSSGAQVDDIAIVGSSSLITAESSDLVTGQLVPIGTIIAFYDFSGALSFNTSYWAYCDGLAAVIGGISRTTPDLSNRYLVGFGTEGGGDIDTASWAITAVGQASHQIDVSHTHTVPAHFHGISVYTGSGGGSGNSVSHSGFTPDTSSDIVGATGGVDGDNAMVSGTNLSATQSIQPRSIRVRYLIRRA